MVIDDIVQPVLAGDVDMFIGMRNRKWYFAHQIIAFIPLLGGERALTKNLWEQVPATYKNNFCIEIALNFYALHYGKGFQFKIFRGLSQTIKEKKYGWLSGTKERWGMMYDIFSTQLKLYTSKAPKAPENGLVYKLKNNKSEA